MFCTSQVLDDASDDDAAMRDASVAASDVNTDHAVGATAPSAADLFKSGATTNNAEVHHRFMMDQHALVADASSNSDTGGTGGTVRDNSMDIGDDFFSRQWAAKGLTSFDLKQYGADTTDRYHAGIKATLTNKAMSLDSSLKRSDALTAPKINLC